jgi:hypothetical protein
MPGRDELIQQNTARVRANSQAPKPQEREGKTSSSISGPRSYLGGNYDVYSKLDKVEFQGILGDASMRGNVAYIRRWKRQGSEQQSASAPSSAVADIPDSQKQLEEALEAAQDNFDAVANNFDEAKQEYNYNPYGDVDNPIEVAEANLQIAENNLNAEKQRALSAQTPISSAPSASPNATPAPTSTTTTGPKATPVGTVKSANPSGFGFALSKVGRAVAGVSPEKIAYSGAAMNGGGGGAGAGNASESAMWQFLFNPAELELDVGPEFKSSETWGVSDKGNSGQPLHWSHNTNAQLKFNSVLLNGYVFGRKVEALEQGLVELFMARDGQGQHGPYILEFVWGKRVFGPCVIKNVNIKEKMWDEGEVVNAELSFTLEQVPEWTINDGFVDVARPGRLAVEGDPTKTSASTATTPTTTGQDKPNPEGGGQPGQKPSQRQDPSADGSAYRTCQKAFELAEVFSQVEISGNLAKANYNRNNGVVLINELFRKYEAAYSQGNSSVGTNFISRVPVQQKPPSIRKSLDSMITAGAMFEKQVDLVRNAALRCKAAMQNTWESSCKKLIADGKAAQIEAQNANSKQALCSGITVGRSCNIGAGNFSPKNPCSGKVLRCNGRGKYEAI